MLSALSKRIFYLETDNDNSGYNLRKVELAEVIEITLLQNFLHELSTW